MSESVQSKPARLRLSRRRQLSLIGSYARERLSRQVRAVAFITAYLVLFQVFVLKAPILDFAQIALGILAVVVGLTLFMEGLFLAIMPLGERCGLRLPARAGLGVLLAFAAVLGITATYAEPAIGFLKAQGSATVPWAAPLLYYMLNSGAPLTVGPSPPASASPSSRAPCGSCADGASRRSCSPSCPPCCCCRDGPPAIRAPPPSSGWRGIPAASPPVPSPSRSSSPWASASPASPGAATNPPAALVSSPSPPPCPC